MNVLPYGPRAVLVEFDSLDDVMAASTSWRSAALAGVVEVVPAALTVLVVHDGSFDVERLPLPESSVPTETGQSVTVPVRYDGIDLADVARATDLSVAEVIDLHSSALYTVAFCGFMPGFSYLAGLHRDLHLPRRASPRTSVPEGSVAIAAGFSAVYPKLSPGGWHLLGRTDLAMWDDDRDPPATLPPGTRVRFLPT